MWCLPAAAAGIRGRLKNNLYEHLFKQYLHGFVVKDTQVCPCRHLLLVTTRLSTSSLVNGEKQPFNPRTVEQRGPNKLTP